MNYNLQVGSEIEHAPINKHVPLSTQGKPLSQSETPRILFMLLIPTDE